jgi:hypothetical protein
MNIFALTGTHQQELINCFDSENLNSFRSPSKKETISPEGERELLQYIARLGPSAKLVKLEQAVLLIPALQPYPLRKIRNRYDYLWKLRNENPERFRNLCEHNSITPYRSEGTFIEEVKSTTVLTEEAKEKGIIPIVKQAKRIMSDCKCLINLFCFVLKVLMINPSRTDFDEEYELNLDDPFGNPDGIVIIRGDKIVVGNEEYDSFIMLHPTWGDIREVTDEKFAIKASISKNGSSILVTKPRFPVFFRDEQNVMQMWSQEDEVFDQIVNSHMIMVNNLDRRGAASFMKTVCYRLPGGVKVKGGPFNSAVDGIELDPQLRFVPLQVGEGEDAVENNIPYIYWHVCLDMPARVIIKKKNSIDVNTKLARMLTAKAVLDNKMAGA